MSRPGIVLAIGLAGCGVQAPDSGLPSFMTAEIETGDDGRCYGRDITPAVIQTVTAQVLDRPAVLAEDGTILTPAAYRTEIRQEIVRERQEIAFETLCPPTYSAEFVASLQRALAARSLYAGPITGIMDSATGQAVQAFQRSDGPDSPLLSLAAARALGLVALSPEQLDAL